MNIAKLDSYRKLKSLRTKMIELEKAIESFEGELMELGGLRAKHYATKYRAEELQQKINTGADHES